MATRTVSLWVLLALSACGPVARSASDAQSSSTPDEEAATRVLTDFHAAAASADEARYFAHLAEDSVFLGTDASERWTKSAFRAYAHPYFARGKAWSFHAVRRSVRVDPAQHIAWFDEDLATENLGPARGTGVLVAREGTWRIAQYNLTLTIPNAKLPLVKATLASVVADKPLSGPLANLAWLAGFWSVKRPNGDHIEEFWSVPVGGSMVGVGRTVRNGEMSFFEYLRIEARGDRVIYIVQPRGKSPTEFVLVPGDSTQATFENLDHDWPKRIRYEKTGQGIAVRIDGAPGSRVEQWIFEPTMLPRAVR